MALWHPDAKRVIYPDLPFEAAPKRLVWHTTEGFGLPTYAGSQPHFTINPKTGALWQHSPVNRAVKTLRNPPGGVNTNTHGAIQVEIIGFARESGSWPASYYDELSDLARWIEANTGVKRTCSVTFGNSHISMSNAKWLAYDGHCGHQHVPENDHWDPGALKIDKILEVNDDPYRRLDANESGPDVTAVQRAINRIATNNCREDRKVVVDGDFGPQTLNNGAWALFMRGVGDNVTDNKVGGLGVNEQWLLRDWDRLSDEQKDRSVWRREHFGCGSDLDTTD